MGLCQSYTYYHAFFFHFLSKAEIPVSALLFEETLPRLIMVYAVRFYVRSKSPSLHVPSSWAGNTWPDL